MLMGAACAAEAKRSDEGAARTSTTGEKESKPADEVERVPAVWAGAVLQSDEAVHVLERIDYDFGSQERHGIYREIPGLAPDAAIEVESQTAPDQVEVTPETIEGEDGVRVRIGDPNTTISGRHRYRIQYEHSALMQDGRFSWDAVGTGWSVPIDDVQVHVVAPFGLFSVTCSVGAARTSGGCEVTEDEPGHISVHVRGLQPGEGITISARRGPDLERTPPLPEPDE